MTLTNVLRYGVKKLTTVCTALLVPLTVLCATFLAVIAVFFATCLAVRTGPACTLPAQTASARMTENNVFMVLNISFQRAEMRLSPMNFDGLTVA